MCEKLLSTILLVWMTGLGKKNTTRHCGALFTHCVRVSRCRCRRRCHYRCKDVERITEDAAGDVQPEPEGLEPLTCGSSMERPGDEEEIG